eukprot:5037578-Alexandrium_andersonii.AAC.1
MIRLALRWVSHLVRQAPATPCSLPARHLGELFRVDAKAEGARVVLGGWVTGSSPDSRAARWFSVRLRAGSAPWAY